MIAPWARWPKSKRWSAGGSYLSPIVISLYRMISSFSQSEATIRMKCDPIYLIHGIWVFKTAHIQLYQRLAAFSLFPSNLCSSFLIISQKKCYAIDTISLMDPWSHRKFHSEGFYIIIVPMMIYDHNLIISLISVTNQTKISSWYKSYNKTVIPFGCSGIWHVYVSTNSHPTQPSASWDVSWSWRMHVIFHSPLPTRGITNNVNQDKHMDIWVNDAQSSYCPKSLVFLYVPLCHICHWAVYMKS